LRAAVALVAVVLAVSCAAQHATAPAAAPQAQGGALADPHQEIEQLAAQIDAERAKLGLAAPAAEAVPMTPHEPMASQVAPLSTADATCRPAPSDTCRDTCELSDSICGNAKKICNLADQLAGDAWAEGKCREAKGLCDEAHGRCCGCQG